jgi:hypothetical protein
LHALAESTTYTARQLFAAVTQGVPVIERQEGGNILHIRQKRLSAEEKRHLEELAQLGYVDGPALATHRATLSIEHQSGSVDRVLVTMATFQGDACTLDFAVSDEKRKQVYRQRTSPNDARENSTKEQRLLTFDVDYSGTGNRSTINLRFSGCDVAIRQVAVE